MFLARGANLAGSLSERLQSTHCGHESRRKRSLWPARDTSFSVGPRQSAPTTGPSQDQCTKSFFSSLCQVKWVFQRQTDTVGAGALAERSVEAVSRFRLGKHQHSVAFLSKVIAETVGLGEMHSRCIARAATSHDVGKLSVSVSVREKCGSLDSEEMLAMRQHPILGHAYLSAFKQTPATRLAATIALQHHEKWDGTGYPFGLSGDQIALESRIVTICDVYDALREERSYRTGITHEAALDVITCGDGRVNPSMFDPIAVNAMTKSEQQIRKVFESLHSEIRV